MNDAQRQVLRSSLGRQSDWLATDRGLLERLRHPSDQEAWQRFSHNYGPLIHRAAVRSGLADWDAQDVTQATLVSVWRRMADFRYEPERCSFKGWLMHLARGHILDQRRKNRTRERWFEPFETLESATTEAVPDEAAEAAFTAVFDEEWERQVLALARRRVRDAVKGKQFEVWWLRCVEGWSVEAVSRRWQVPQWWVRLVSHRVGRRMEREVRRLAAREFRADGTRRGPDVQRGSVSGR
jgi:RNA polymerase sigma factor (sigma-70 family)